MELIEELFNTLKFDKENENKYQVLFQRRVIDGTLMLLITDNCLVSKPNDDISSIDGEIDISSFDNLDVDMTFRIVKANKLIGEESFTFRLNKDTMSLSDDNTKKLFPRDKLSELEYNLAEIKRIYDLVDGTINGTYYVDDDLTIYLI